MEGGFVSDKADRDEVPTGPRRDQARASAPALGTTTRRKRRVKGGGRASARENPPIKTGTNHFSLAFTYAWMAADQLFNSGPPVFGTEPLGPNLANMPF